MAPRPAHPPNSKKMGGILATAYGTKDVVIGRIESIADRPGQHSHYDQQQEGNQRCHEVDPCAAILSQDYSL